MFLYEKKNVQNGMFRQKAKHILQIEINDHSLIDKQTLEEKKCFEILILKKANVNDKACAHAILKRNQKRLTQNQFMSHVRVDV